MFGCRCQKLAGGGGVSIVAELARCAGGITVLETLSGAGGRYEAARELHDPAPKRAPGKKAMMTKVPPKPAPTPAPQTAGE